MHEIGMCQGVVAAVQQRAGDRQVTGLGVRAGPLLGIHDDHFAEAFGMVAAGTVAEGAEVDLEIVPLEATCRQCGTEFTTTDPLPACPDCDSVELDRTGGDELTLVWLRYADGDDGSDATGTPASTGDTSGQGH